jgi:hypothetical protein
MTGFIRFPNHWLGLSTYRHCERSEAIQGNTRRGCDSWIASSPFGLLAMTAHSFVRLRIMKVS